jgi:hypothetical protein
MAINQNARRGDPRRAHFVSFNFTNTLIPVFLSIVHRHGDRTVLAGHAAVAISNESAKLRQ